MKSAIKSSLAILAVTGLLAACNSGDDKATSADAADAVAVVNGEAINQVRFETYAAQRTGGPAEALDPAMRDQVINELVNITLLAQRAEAMELHKEPEMEARLAFERNTTLADAAMRSHLEDNPVTQEQVRAEYEERKAELAATEYKARHILVEDQATAEALIAELDGGADFVALAKENSTEPGASESGGDLGWFVANQMVAPFSDAVKAMEPGNYSSAPVQTQFGWHVILLEDLREVEPPAFEEVAQRIERFLTNQRIQAYINELRGKANVDMKSATPEPEAPSAAAEEAPAEAAEEAASEDSDGTE